MISTRAKKITAVLLAAAGVLVAVLVVTSNRGPQPGRAANGRAIPRFVPGSPEVPPRAEPPETPQAVALEVDSTMAAWRNAVAVRDADTVVRIDGAFQASPERYRDALVESASGDADERVRAFSTRVLGKLKRAALADTFEKLLQDKSPYVRQNAAWALGELAAEESGRQAAKHALAELRHVKKRDPAGDVRSAAKGAIERLE
jgi:hypothetical protein